MPTAHTLLIDQPCSDPSLDQRRLASRDIRALEHRIVTRLIAEKNRTHDKFESLDCDVLSIAAANSPARDVGPVMAGQGRIAERVIAVLSATLCLMLLASFSEELLWAVLAAGTMYAIGAGE